MLARSVKTPLLSQIPHAPFRHLKESLIKSGLLKGTAFSLREELSLIFGSGVWLTKNEPRRGRSAVSPGRSAAESWVGWKKVTESRRDGTVLTRSLQAVRIRPVTSAALAAERFRRDLIRCNILLIP